MKAHINADGFAEQKSANRLYKESGSSLPFKQWLQSQQAKGELLNDSGTDAITAALSSVSGSSSSSNSSSASTEKKKPSLDDIIGYVGKAAEGGEKLFTLGTSIANTVKQAKADKNAAKVDADLNNIKNNTGGGDTKPTKSSAGVPTVVWYGVGGIGVVLVGYFVYKNFIATGDTTAVAPVAIAAK